MIFCMFGVCVGHTGVSVSDYFRSNFDKSCCIKSNHRDLFNHPPCFGSPPKLDGSYSPRTNRGCCCWLNSMGDSPAAPSSENGALWEHGIVPDRNPKEI